MKTNHSSDPRTRRGAMQILIAMVLILLLIGAVFGVDIAYMHMVRAELQAATDFAARAGAETLSRTQDQTAARKAAIEIAERNLVAGNGLSLSPEDISFGSVSPGADGRFHFVANQSPLCAVQIRGRRVEGAIDGPVGLFFARVFSTNDFQLSETATAATNVRDVALVLDVSGSMSTKLGKGTRLSALQDAVNIFLDEVELTGSDTRVSLISYSTSPSKLVDLTDDYEGIRRRVSRLKADGLTAIGDALLMGSDSLVYDRAARSFANKTIILMTDGNHNTGPSPEVTVATAVRRNQQVHTITFSSGANQELMKRVAAATQGGIHIHADDADDLAEAFREMARTLSVMLLQ